MLYIQLGQVNLAKVLDKKGRNKAVAANLVPFITIVACVSFWIIENNPRALTLLLGICLVVLSFIIGLKIQTAAIIESVYRCKDGKNKTIYLKNKAFFDKKFKKYDNNDRPCIKKTHNR